MDECFLSLSTHPLPHSHFCGIKRFIESEYHCVRKAPLFVLIFVLEGTLHFDENQTPISLSAGEPSTPIRRRMGRIERRQKASRVSLLKRVFTAGLILT